MDDLLSEFLTETAENLEVLDVELITFEKSPNDKTILNNIFRLVHTIKGTCGFLDLPRLEAVAHVAETVLGKFRDGVLTVTPAAVTLILESLDQIKELLAYLEHNASEPEGDDKDLIARLTLAAEGGLSGEGSEAPSTAHTETDAEALERAFEEAEVDVPFGVTADVLENDETENEETPLTSSLSKPTDQSSSVQEKNLESSLKNQSIRVNVDILEHLMTMVSELVLTRNQLLQMVRGNEDSEFKVPMQRLSNVTAELQDAVMKTRMQPIGNAWKKLPRIIRDISQDLDKKIELNMQGAETELDRQVLELIKDPLTHMVRNSCDHGLESLEKRRELGKPEAGQVTLRAYHEGGHIIIEIEDDGQGLDVERIKEKILSKDLVPAAELETMSEQQIQRFIFNPGFSTAEKVTSVSGRGVGMDVVRTNIEVIGGSIDLRSVAGKGSIFIIKIPLTLAIVSALLVDSGGFKFAIPQLSVVELVRSGAGSDSVIECVNKTQLLRLRNRLLPLITLSELLGLENINSDAAPHDNEVNEEIAPTKTQSKAQFVVVTQVGPQRFGIVVDNVFDTEEIVVKPVSSILRHLPTYSGTTILGDGSVIMIIDPAGIAAKVDSHESDDAENKVDAVTHFDRGMDTTSLLIFKAGSGESKAVPLSLITRLEEIAVGDIEPSNGQNLVQYRGRLMPIVHVSPGATLKNEGRQPVLVFADGERSLGLAVDEIVDIVEETLDIEMASQQPGLIGSAVLKEKATEIIDVSHYLTQHQSNWFDNTSDSTKISSRRILLVDDSAFFRNMMKPLISAAGYDVTAVETASEALDLRDKGAAFDLVISDIEMPETDGLALARAIRQDDKWGEVPLVALTSNTSAEDEEKGFEAGFHKYVSKTDRSALIDIIHETLTVKGSAA